MMRPLKGWLAEQARTSFPAIYARAVDLEGRAAAQGLHLLLCRDAWRCRDMVMAEAARLEAEWRQRAARTEGWPPAEPPAGHLPIFRSHVDPVYSDLGPDSFAAILGVNAEMPTLLLSTNVSVRFRMATIRMVIEQQRLWGESPERYRADTTVKLGWVNEAADRFHARIAHCGTAWVTPSMRGRRSDGVPVAAHLAPLMRCVAWLAFDAEAVFGTVGDARLTRTFGSRVDGTINVTRGDQAEQQTLHLYDAADIATLSANG